MPNRAVLAVFSFTLLLRRLFAAGDLPVQAVERWFARGVEDQEAVLVFAVCDVVGDSFVERGELRQAKATFESVRDGYQAEGPSDDVVLTVSGRGDKDMPTYIKNFNV